MTNDFSKLDAQDEISRLAQVSPEELKFSAHLAEIKLNEKLETIEEDEIP